MIRRRCAIYTRKSTEEGLEQAFNSLDAQREACAAYILSQRHEGWSERGDRYDDGGFSGGSMDRPGLQRLLQDVRAGRIDVIVVYKVDRLTRSLADFAKMVEVFDGAGVSFVSVTQAFNTTSSMGRLTLNVLLSFAQFEREVTAERIRDKVAASRRKGLWMGGPVPLGYDVRDKTLVVNQTEAEAVRTVFREYVALASVPALRRRLAELGVVSKRRVDRHGRATGGAAFSRGALYALLRNPTYVGKVRHKCEMHEVQQDAVIDNETWARAQELLNGHGGHPIATRRAPARRPLDGLIYDGEARPMRTTYALKSKEAGGARQAKRYWYYVSRKSGGRPASTAPERIPAEAMETAIRDAVAQALGDTAWVSDRLSEAGLHSGQSVDAVQQAGRRAEVVTASDISSVPDGLLARIDLAADRLLITFDLGALVTAPPAIDRIDARIEVPFERHQNGRARPIVLRTGNGVPRQDADLIALMADARRWMRELLDGRAKSVEEITLREGLRKGSVSRILPLAFLAPDITTMILDGHQPPALTAKRLRDLRGLPLRWRDQREALGLAPR